MTGDQATSAPGLTQADGRRLPEDDRRHVLDENARIVRDEFGGRVDRRCVTILYTARRNET